MAKRAFPPPLPSDSSLILPPDVPLEEEMISDYSLEFFYPVNPGDIFHDRYKTTAKRQAGRYVVLKVNNCDFSDQDGESFAHNGFPLVRTIIDSFEVIGPDGTHICLVYESRRESLRLFRRHFTDSRLPLPLLKGYLQMPLMGLDYLHSECQIIHIDLKLDNILVGFEDPSVIEDFVQGQAKNPMARKAVNGRSIYQSHNGFGPLRSLYILPKIADIGLAQRGDSSQPHLHPIQPDHYRAPEVVLGTGWTYSADIWNLGVLIWNLLENKDLFTSVHSADGKYNSQAHLAEIIALLGPPRKLIDQERDRRTWKWGTAIENAESKLCDSASTYYGGPFFDSKGEFMHKDLVSSHLHLTDSVTSLQGSEKSHFLAFVRKMLQWLPEDRKTARELLEDPWLSV
ncbi:kinase domain-containing protein [Leptodontidium sp. MPI-SDFR-AT-0119]|nr:kinase domain-containing protein [Leptodontidium sp. MPI-SDFR-AT-0119]